MTDAAVTGNVIEDNQIMGNSNGFFIAAGVQGNTIRGNTILGNPPVQIAVDHPAPASAGFDIMNLATAGANTLTGNVCLSALNAPCGPVAASLTASPNPIPVTGAVHLGATTLAWNAPDAERIEIRMGAPDGPLFTTMGNRGSIQTGPWVSNGTVFYLQDVTGGRPLTADFTLARVVVRLDRK